MWQAEWNNIHRMIGRGTQDNRDQVVSKILFKILPINM